MLAASSAIIKVPESSTVKVLPDVSVKYGLKPWIEMLPSIPVTSVTPVFEIVTSPVTAVATLWFVAFPKNIFAESKFGVWFALPAPPTLIIPALAWLLITLPIFWMSAASLVGGVVVKSPAVVLT